MKLKLNAEYARNHLFVTILMAGLGLWFAYDGFVKYPATPAAELYEQIEKAKPEPDYNVEAFKAQKIQTQYGFTFLSLLASVVIGLRLLKSARFDFAFDDDGFFTQGTHFSYADVTAIDDRLWDKKSIVRVTAGGRVFTLDAWHHEGVKEFHEKLKCPVDNRQGI